ncbi:autophagy-related protein 2 [Elasticomyces elasticus]|uniref:Autophagy-related protein 2 n=1 Tax=Exophiala sideris TaxID=1016849 RepID=A0ABR0IYP7_9EURO|nr:autophagy-related protein 2 [Elasticomyces elasticus]KAK5022493.1 autophagy- protein 2 [Exophiala sideris]KAK5028021.1 autophagy-related protein 2 [Exophiala sideris]KAK5051763.1 autophagy- protein 2 [Exophiala sideris]KAK5177906.1 autophagy- protein 2 [Eurotiomycetes sp. CCFEE 6388]
MSYFLPSYFQKRLLRYALSRLDFIDSDEFDLDNLGLTWGQRTVLELKNVGLKVKRLTDTLHLPPSFTLTHASIRLLRLTLPADLHVSGIEVEVEGVEIVVGVRHDTADKTQSRGGRQPNKSDRANLPRLSSPPVHDPGGRRSHGRHEGPLELSQVLPTSEDLANSFLERESPGERDELQAALESQSQYMHESVASSQADDVGLGMPGGLSLPSFVANFLKGVGDRLSVNVKDVNVIVEMDLSASGGLAAENTKFMLVVGNVTIDPLQQAGAPDVQPDPRRSIRLDELQFFALSESETFSEFSGSSSPKLSRSRHRLAHTEDNGSINDAAPSNSASLSGQSARSKLSSHSPSSSRAGLGLDKALLADSGIFERTTRFIPLREESSNESTPIDNKARAQGVLETHPAQSEGEQEAEIAGSENLAESKVFTHDEAASMYMSAVSGRLDMPGGWGWSNPEMNDPETQDQRSSESHVDVSNINDHHERTGESHGSDEARTSNGESILQTTLSPYYRSGILRLNMLRLSIPQPDQNASAESRQTSSSSISNPRSQRHMRPSSSSMVESTFLNDPRLSNLRSQGQPPIRDYTSNGLRVDVGEVFVDLDITVTKILVMASQAVSEALPKVDEESAKPSASGSKPAPPAVLVQQVILNLCEAVPKTPPSNVTLQPIESMTVHDSALLKLSLSAISFGTAAGHTEAQRLSIVKVVMTHGDREVLSFVDSINVRDSIASSSMLRPHDIAATMTGNRFEVQIKPVHIVLDLLVIDDVLTKSGGLSSLLDLGNSIVSTHTVKGLPTPPAPDVRKQRTVRFNDPQRRPRAESDPLSPAPKIDVRISGARLDLIGSESTVQVKTSAIKTVYRQNNMRLVIDGAAIEGPVVAASTSRADLYAKLRNIELHYSDTPDDDDLDRLLSLITPSSDKYDQDDDIMVDTLLRQRRKGGVLRLAVGDLQAGAVGLGWIPHLTKVADEISKLSSVTKYLPEDDRPGILTFGLVKTLDVQFDIDEKFGPIKLKADLVEGAHINVPSLAAAQVASWKLSRSENDVLIGEVTSQTQSVMGPPMFMCRFIADEMEPTVRLKLSNTCTEYKVATIEAISSLAERLQDDPLIKTDSPVLQPSSPSTSSIGDPNSFSRKVRVSLAFRDSAIALNPDRSPARGLFVLTDAVIRHENHKKGSTNNLEIRKASLLIINDSSTIGQDSANVDQKLYFEENDQVQQLIRAGFVPVGSMSSAFAVVKVIEDKVSQQTQLDIEFRNNLLFLETCADSTQTMFQILGGLTPPSPPSKVAKYRTEIVPIQDMLASFTGNAFVSEAGPDHGLQASRTTNTGRSPGQEPRSDDGYQDEDEDEDDHGFMTDIYPDADDADDEMTASHVESDLGRSTMSESIHIAPVEATSAESAGVSESIMMHSLLDFRTDHFAPKTSVDGTAHRWNSAQNTYGLASDAIFERSPIKVRVRDVHIIWNLFDGYDWQATRDKISQTVKDIEAKALARRPRSSSRATGGEEEDESVIGDFLFNSIYIGVPANRDPRELTNAINHDIDDMVSETGSYATRTTVTAATTHRHSGPIPRQKRLKLNRSKHHKMAFELEGVSADFLAFPSGSGEVESSIDIRVKKVEVFDHIPTSTWKKFATYMQDAGEREVCTNMVHIEILNVKPVAELAASEMVVKITVLPLRLHVDQDALDFMSRFFEFKDDSATASTTPSIPLFLQRVEVNAIQVKLDFKPKRVDYAGLRSGRTTEMMNFFVLDRADMVLRRVILYGVSGLDRLGIMLNNIWTPDVRRNQLPGVLAGLAPIRPLVDVGSGVRDLIAVPIREYRKDGRIVRSIQKGALAFAKTTATELVNLGAKMAIGTQQVLQNTEGLFVQGEHTGDPDIDEESKKQISLYADQPVGIRQGLRTAYGSLERDLLIAKDAIVAIPGEVMAGSSAKGAARAILKQSPTIILRPAIGATKAVGQTLMGAGNTLDKQNLRRVDEKYKRH